MTYDEYCPSTNLNETNDLHENKQHNEKLKLSTKDEDKSKPIKGNSIPPKSTRTNKFQQQQHNTRAAAAVDNLSKSVNSFYSGIRLEDLLFGKDSNLESFDKAVSKEMKTFTSDDANQKSNEKVYTKSGINRPRRESESRSIANHTLSLENPNNDSQSAGIIENPMHLSPKSFLRNIQGVQTPAKPISDPNFALDDASSDHPILTMHENETNEITTEESKRHENENQGDIQNPLLNGFLPQKLPLQPPPSLPTTTSIATTRRPTFLPNPKEEVKTVDKAMNDIDYLLSSDYAFREWRAHSISIEPFEGIQTHPQIVETVQETNYSNDNTHSDPITSRNDNDHDNGNDNSDKIQQVSRDEQNQNDKETDSKNIETVLAPLAISNSNNNLSDVFKSGINRMSSGVNISMNMNMNNIISQENIDRATATARMASKEGWEQTKIAGR